MNDYSHNPFGLEAGISSQKLEQKPVLELPQPMSNQEQGQGVRTDLEPKRSPTQARAKQRLQQIISSCNTILGRDGISGLTMPKLAKEAGISVGSLYQYFPNKLAVLKSLYESYLEGIREVIDEFILETQTSDGNWEQDIGELFDRLFYAEQNNGPIPELMQAMALYPDLDDIDLQHSELIVRRFVSLFKSYNIPGRPSELEQLSQFLYALNIGSWHFRERFNKPKQLANCNKWEKAAVIGVIEEYISSH